MTTVEFCWKCIMYSKTIDVLNRGPSKVLETFNRLLPQTYVLLTYKQHVSLKSDSQRIDNVKCLTSGLWWRNVDRLNWWEKIVLKWVSWHKNKPCTKMHPYCLNSCVPRQALQKCFVYRKIIRRCIWKENVKQTFRLADGVL